MAEEFKPMQMKEIYVYGSRSVSWLGQLRNSGGGVYESFVD